MSSYRFVILVDVEAESLEEAYHKLYVTQRVVDTEDYSWESTDEAFDPEGEEIDPETLSEVRMKVVSSLAQNN